MTQLAPDQVNNYIVKKLIQNLIIECSSSTHAERVLDGIVRA